MYAGLSGSGAEWRLQDERETGSHAEQHRSLPSWQLFLMQVRVHRYTRLNK